MKVALAATNGKHVEQCLGGMGVPTVPRIDDMNFRAHMPRDEVCRAALGVPHYEHIGMHGGKVVHRIQQCLAFRL